MIERECIMKEDNALDLKNEIMHVLHHHDNLTQLEILTALAMSSGEWAEQHEAQLCRTPTKDEK